MRLYRTHDIALAAFLAAKGYQLQEISKPQRQGQWQEFIFSSDPALDNQIQAYFDGGQIPARAYASLLSRLKTAMYKSQRGESYDVGQLAAGS